MVYLFSLFNLFLSLYLKLICSIEFEPTSYPICQSLPFTWSVQTISINVVVDIVLSFSPCCLFSIFPTVVFYFSFLLKNWLSIFYDSVFLPFQRISYNSLFYDSDCIRDYSLHFYHSYLHIILCFFKYRIKALQLYTSISSLLGFILLLFYLCIYYKQKVQKYVINKNFYFCLVIYLLEDSNNKKINLNYHCSYHFWYFSLG